MSSEEASQKPFKKEKKAKRERLLKRQELSGASASAAPDPLAANYGEIPLSDLQSNGISGKVWTKIEELNEGMKGQSVLVRGRVQTRAKGKNMAFVVLKQGSKSLFNVQCFLTEKPDEVSRQMVAFAATLNLESIVDVYGLVSLPPQPIKGTSQQVEIQVSKIYYMNKAASLLPFNLEDAARSEVDITQAEEAGKQFVRVNQDTRLNNRFLDLRTRANQGIFRIKDEVVDIFREFLKKKEGFVGIQTPKVNAGSSEGGSAVFELDYFGTPACLAQSPQIYKQMAICSGFDRVFEVGPVFRAENSHTHRHLCEFTGLDAEMVINEHYSEVMDIVDRLFVNIFDHLHEKCKMELEAINSQFPFQKLKYLRNTLRLTFEEGVQMLKEAGVEIDPLGDLNTETERKLGQLVLEKYDTEFYILHRFPLAVRPFYTMPCPDDNKYSNSFDAFIRGEEIISGAQRIHLPELLTERAQSLGIDVKSISAYIDAFRYGTPLHGGFGAGLERVVMLFCALDNIRKTSLFPRDPKRITP